MKKFIVMGGIAITAVALAATVVRAKGSGVVTNPAGVKGEFVMDVWKETNGEIVRVGGNARFGTGIRRADGLNGRRYIELTQVTTVSKVGRTLVAYGRGAMHIAYPNHPVVTTQGYVRVAVEDRKTATGMGDLDKFGIRFQASTSSFVFEFGGLVRPGDIVVQ
jgi:hypothetical protein